MGGDANEDDRFHPATWKWTLARNTPTAPNKVEPKDWAGMGMDESIAPIIDADRQSSNDAVQPWPLPEEYPLPGFPHAGNLAGFPNAKTGTYGKEGLMLLSASEQSEQPSRSLGGAGNSSEGGAARVVERRRVKAREPTPEELRSNIGAGISSPLVHDAPSAVSYQKAQAAPPPTIEGETEAETRARTRNLALGPDRPPEQMTEQSRINWRDGEGPDGDEWSHQLPALLQVGVSLSPGPRAGKSGDDGVEEPEGGDDEPPRVKLERRRAEDAQKKEELEQRLAGMTPLPGVGTGPTKPPPPPPFLKDMEMEAGALQRQGERDRMRKLRAEQERQIKREARMVETQSRGSMAPDPETPREQVARQRLLEWTQAQARDWPAGTGSLGFMMGFSRGYSRGFPAGSRFMRINTPPAPPPSVTQQINITNMIPPFTLPPQFAALGDGVRQAKARIKKAGARLERALENPISTASDLINGAPADPRLTQTKNATEKGPDPAAVKAEEEAEDDFGGGDPQQNEETKGKKRKGLRDAEMAQEARQSKEDAESGRSMT